MRPASLAAILSLAVVACSPASKNEKSDPLNSDSAMPAIFIIGAAPEIMRPSAVYEGVWLFELEGSQFFENETTIRKRYNDIYFDTWLVVRVSDPAFPPKSPLTEYQGNYGKYSANFMLLKFIGRRNVFPGLFGFGHLGTSRNVIVVEKVISAKPLSR